MKIQSARDISKNEKIKLMIYGASGSGKTKLIGTLKEKILLLNADKGLMTVSGQDIDYFTTTSWKEVVEFLDYLKTKECQEKYTWIGFDTVTAMFDLLYASLEKRQETDSKFDNFSFWKEYGGRLINFLRIIRDQNQYNVIALLQHSTKEDKDMVSQPAFGLQGGSATRPPDFFDEVFALRLGKEGARILQTSTNGVHIAKDRSQKLEKNEVADLSLIMNKIREKK